MTPERRHQMNVRLGRLFAAVCTLTRKARSREDWARAERAQRLSRRLYDQWAWEIHLPKRTLAEYRADLARGRVDLLEAELCGPWGRPGDVVHVSFRDRGLAGEPVISHPVEDAFDLPALVAPPGATRRELSAAAARAWAF